MAAVVVGPGSSEDDDAESHWENAKVRDHAEDVDEIAEEDVDVKVDVAVEKEEGVYLGDDGDGGNLDENGEDENKDEDEIVNADD